MAHLFQGDFSRLDSKERKKILPARSILKELKIKKGDTLVDFGCGIGYFSIPALDFVGDNGTVIAIDVSEEMLKELAKRAGYKKNLLIIQSDSLIGFNADVILLVMVLHEVDNPDKFLLNCFEVLNPSGRVVVIDWQKMNTGSMGPPVEHRLDKESVLRMTKSKFIDHPIHKWLYFLEFMKDG